MKSLPPSVFRNSASSWPDENFVNRSFCISARWRAWVFLTCDPNQITKMIMINGAKGTKMPVHIIRVPPVFRLLNDGGARLVNSGQLPKSLVLLNLECSRDRNYA